MNIKNFKVGQKVNHKNYGEGKVVFVYDDEDKPQNNGVLIGELSGESLKAFNKDRQIKNMPIDSTQILERIFENDLSLLNILS